MPMHQKNITVPGVIAGGLLAAPLFLFIGLLIRKGTQECAMTLP